MKVLVDKSWTDRHPTPRVDTSVPHEVRDKFVNEHGDISYYLHIPNSGTNGLIPQRNGFMVEKWLYKNHHPEKESIIDGRLKDHLYIAGNYITEVDVATTNQNFANLLAKEW
jgi:hypothetical protein